MTSKRHRKQAQPDWLLPFGDMVVLVLAFFFLLVPASGTNPDRILQSFLDSFSSVRDSWQTSNHSRKKSDILFEKLADEAKKIIREGNLTNRVAVNVNQRGLVITIEADALFHLESTNVQMEMKPLLLEIALLVKKLPYQIIVEGHTDKRTAVSEKFSSNWEFSAARAAAVVQVMAEEGGADPKRFSAVGHAEFRPRILPNGKGERKHQRVEIIISRKSHNS